MGNTLLALILYKQKESRVLEKGILAPDFTLF
jgi:hypothetical protein